MAAYDPKRTQVAQSVVDFGKYFEAAFAQAVVHGAVPYRPLVHVPEDMSTAGGKRARQAITLQPHGGGATVTVGWVDVPSRQALLRSHGCLAAMHQARFPGRAFGVDRASFDQFFQQAHDLLKACGLAVQIENAPAGLASESREAPVEVAVGYSAGFLAIIGTMTFLLGVVVGAAVVYYRFAG